MKIPNSKSSEKCLASINEIISEMNALPEMSWADIDNERTAVFVVDIVNGFVREGAMASPSVAAIIPNVAALMEKCNAVEMPVVALCDCHKKNAAEFASFPEHCVEGTKECELVDELKKVSGYFLMKKNSTNAFHEKELLQCLIQNPQTNTFIVTGDCTDICVLQFCLTLKTWYTQQNRSVKIIIPLDCVDTYDAPSHNAELMNIAAYKLMKDSGITFVKTIK